MNVQEIHEMDAKFQVQFWIIITWFDKRLSFNHLKENKNFMILEYEEMHNIWSPKIVFYNTEKKLSSKIDEDTRMVVKKQGTFTLSTVDKVENRRNFQGSENYLEKSNFYNLNFMCDFDMSWYPFDSQQCSLMIQLHGESWKFSNLINESFQYYGKTDLMLYFIKSHSYMTLIEEGNPTLKAEIVLGRRLLSISLTTILPTIVLILTSYSTNFFQDVFFEAVVTVNLTIMLGKAF